MQLSTINKNVYRNRVNQILGGFVVSVLALSLIFSEVLDARFGVAGGIDSEWLAFTAFVMAFGLCAAVLHGGRKHSLLQEVVYVCRLKWLLWQIGQRLSTLKLAAGNGDGRAVEILLFYFRGRMLVYSLDNAGGSLATLELELIALQVVAEDKGIVPALRPVSASGLKPYWS
ncbi:DUF3087 family protein [Ferrimonas pelagia]|uniref:DUF304 domain-containing protein n=1 Tax=Ferrimonas pelagia TaxID=1177826 RepID=A0ABP9FE60_9GAMM